MNKDKVDFNGNKFLVTGASSGIGKSIAIYLSKLNAKLLIVGRDEERLLETYNLLEGHGHKYFCLDLFKNNDTIEDLFKYGTEDGIKFDGLVHSAGVVPTIPIQQLTRQKVHEIMGINLYSFIELMRQYEKKKYSAGGSVVAISSIAAVQPEKCQTIYSSSKFALNAAVKTLSIELKKKNIRVNSLLPGVTGDIEIFKNEPDLMKLAEKQMLGLIPYDAIAPIVTFLLSDQTKYVTGREFYYDAGRF